MDDDILREIRAYRDAYAAKFDYDMGAMHRDLLARQGEEGRRVVSFAEPRPAPSTGDAAESIGADACRVAASATPEPRR
jgi:hypothetical protein